MSSSISLKAMFPLRQRWSLRQLTKGNSQKIEQYENNSAFICDFTVFLQSLCLFFFVVCSSNRLKTSDSDFSDTEGGRTAKLNITQGRVRQAALALLSTIVKVCSRFKNYSLNNTRLLLSECR